MSVEAIGLVLNHSRAKGTAKLVLLGIANHDGDGGAWPKIETLARYANASERSVQRSIAELVELGEVVVHVNGGGTRSTPNDRRPNRYEITVTPRTDPVDNPGDGVTPVSPRSADGVTPMTPRGDAGVADGVTPVSPEPSLNHPEPHASARAGDGNAEPVDEAAQSIDALRRAFDQDVRLVGLGWALKDDQAHELASLVRRHGVARLLAVAIRHHRDAVTVKAFLHHWRGLTGTNGTSPAPTEPRCPTCTRATSDCRRANQHVPEPDRCPPIEESR